MDAEGGQPVGELRSDPRGVQLAQHVPVRIEADLYLGRIVATLTQYKPSF